MGNIWPKTYHMMTWKVVDYETGCNLSFPLYIESNSEATTFIESHKAKMELFLCIFGPYR